MEGSDAIWQKVRASLFGERRSHMFGTSLHSLRNECNLRKHLESLTLSGVVMSGIKAYKCIVLAARHCARTV